MTSLTLSSAPSTRSAPPEAAGATEAAAVLSRHAQDPSAFLALNAETRHFRANGIDGLVAYRPAGRRYLVQLGSIVADPADGDALLDAFLAFAAASRRRVVAVQLQGTDAARYAAAGFRVNQFGASYARSLGGFTLGGKHFMRLRNKISRARRAGVEVVEVGRDVAETTALAGELAELDAAWLRSKGRHVKELAFMVGERGGPGAGYRRLFAARLDGRVVAYVSFSPVYGERAGWLHDLSRRRPDAPPGTMELVVWSAVERIRDEVAGGWLHFGFTPFVGLDPAHEVAGAGSRVTARAVRLLAERGAVVYPAADQVAYKEKWAPDLVQPEYVAFQGRVRLGAVWQLLRLTRAI